MYFSPELRYSVNIDSRSRRVKTAGISSPSVRILRHKNQKREKVTSDLTKDYTPAIISKADGPIRLKRGKIWEIIFRHTQMDTQMY